MASAAAASSPAASGKSGPNDNDNDNDGLGHEQGRLLLSRMLSSRGRATGGRRGNQNHRLDGPEDHRSSSNENVNDAAASSSTFSVVEYLNSALLWTASSSSSSSSSKGGTTTTTANDGGASQQQQQQQRLAELALQLQIETSHCHEAIGRVSAELQAIVPRCASDVTRLGMGLSNLQEDAQSLLQATTDRRRRASEGKRADGEATAAPSLVDAGTSNNNKGLSEGDAVASGGASATTTSLETLSTLHGLQSGLARTKEILIAVSAWDETLRSVPALLAQNQLDKAVQALVLLETYRQRLQGMPTGNQERQIQHDKVRKQVMDLLAPVLQNAVSAVVTSNGRVLQPLQHCVHMYARLGALQVLQAEYVKSRPSQVHKLWFQFDMARDRMTTFVPTWLDAVYQLVADEVRQSAAVFGAGGGGGGGGPPNSAASSPTLPLAVTIRVLHECFRPLRASWSSRLEALCSSSASNTTSNPTSPSTGAHDWEGLCAVYESILQFLSMVYGTVAGTYQDLQESGALGGSGGRDSRGSAVGASADDSAEAAAVIMSPAQLHKELASAFVAVAAPFAAFQERFGTIESAHSSRRAQEIVSDMRAVLVRAASSSDEVGGVGTGMGPNDKPLGGTADGDQFPPRSITLEGLSRATEGLMNESTRIFELADGSLDRYDLMLGGYSVVDSALRPVDAVVAAHLDELSSLVATLTRLTRESLLLSSTGGGDVAHWHLDESVVTASLQVLHVAGAVVRRFDEFANHARQRLAVWTERLASTSSAGLALPGADAGGPATVRSFTLPDSMAPVDVDSIVTQFVSVAVFRQDASTALSILQKLGSSDSSSNVSSVSLFPLIEASVARLCRSCQIQVFETCSTVPLRHLAGMSSLPCWRAGSSSSSAGGGSEYGTLPQSYITQVGEHMLSLVQALEPFASNMDSLAVAGPVMSGVRQVAAAPWREFLQATGAAIPADANAGKNVDDDQRRDLVLLQIMDGTSFSTPLDGQGENSRSDEEQLGDAMSGVDDVQARLSGLDPNDASAASGAITAFCNAWLDAVGCAVTGRLLERILRIPSLSPKGCEHLQADLTYLVNVLSALDVSGHPHPLLVHVAELASSDGAELSERIAREEVAEGIGNGSGASSGHATSSEVVLRALEERVAAIRGVAARYNY